MCVIQAQCFGPRTLRVTRQQRCRGNPGRLEGTKSCGRGSPSGSGLVGGVMECQALATAACGRWQASSATLLRGTRWTGGGRGPERPDGCSARGVRLAPAGSGRSFGHGLDGWRGRLGHRRGHLLPGAYPSLIGAAPGASCGNGY